MNNEQIKKIALENGFVLKSSFDGKEYRDLHRYVYQFARALIAANQGGMPEGWKLVPVELTDVQEVAGIFAASQMPDVTGLARLKEKRRAIYRAQLAAAPTPSAPSAPSAPEGWKLVPIDPTPEMIRTGEDYSDWGCRCASVAYGVMVEAAPTPPAQEAEPVAYALQTVGGKIAYWAHSKETVEEHHKQLPHCKFVEVFTSAPSDKLRQAARDVVVRYRLGNNCDLPDLNVCLERLSEALKGKS